MHPSNPGHLRSVPMLTDFGGHYFISIYLKLACTLGILFTFKTKSAKTRQVIKLFSISTNRTINRLISRPSSNTHIAHFNIFINSKATVNQHSNSKTDPKELALKFYLFCTIFCNFQSNVPYTSLT